MSNEHNEPSPGPWRWADADDGRVNLVAADGHVILQDVDTWPTDYGGEANSALVAKAWAIPEMLKLLREIHARDFDYAWDRIDALLRKVDGK